MDRGLFRTHPGLPGVALLAAALAACGPTDPIPPGPSVALELVASLPGAAGNPVQLREAPDGSGRLFVLGQAGRVHVLAGGVVDPVPILDMTARGIDLTEDFEGGALDLAFHPGFAGVDGPAGEGLLYTFAHEESDGAADFDHPELPGVSPVGQTVLREWRIDPADPGAVLPGSRVLLRIDQPQPNHNGGGLAFDAQGRLYLSVGDGGGSDDNAGGVSAPGDGHTDGIGNGQDRSNVYGAILRIDPLGSDAANGQYGIPAGEGGNPFVGNDQGWVEEIFAWGLRNPYRISVDGDGRLWAGDVGQGAREEIDLVAPGSNHGWPFLEGTRVNRAGGPAGTVAPVGEYTRADGTAVLGGHVYAGPAVAALQGRYVFGDFRDDGAGRLYEMDPATGAIRELVLLPGGDLPPAQGALYGVGRDAAGEIHYLMRPFPAGGDGSILRVVAAPGDQDGDGVGDGDDLCRGVPDPDQADTDADGAGDACDVCTEVADPAQRDRDLDGTGDRCDCDFTGEGACNIDDFSVWLPDFLAGVETTLGTDMDGDGTVNIEDFQLLLPGLVRGTPGPSAP